MPRGTFFVVVGCSDIRRLSRDADADDAFESQRPTTTTTTDDRRRATGDGRQTTACDARKGCSIEACARDDDDDDDDGAGDQGDDDGDATGPGAARGGATPRGVVRARRHDGEREFAW